ncbi:MAG TPA: hypothetical protein VF411_05195 [Bacteroidia bacterium]
MPVDKFGNNYFDIEFPAIKSASVFYFNTTSGLRYEVRFGRRQDNILHATIVFGVVNDEFEGEEYVTTNRGQVYTVMSTISEIVRTFMGEHPKITTYEFHAVGKDNEKDLNTNARMYLYRRFLPRIFEKDWLIDIKGNFALVKKRT